MIGAASAVPVHLAEAATQGSESGPPAWAVGVGAFIALVLLLFIVTRFNRDR